MIIIAGHKDLDKKMLKRCVGYQEFAVIDATDGDEFEDWNVEKDNGFTPAGKLYRENSDYFYARAMNNKEEAIKNFFTSLDFITSMEKLISRFVEAKGEIKPTKERALSAQFKSQEFYGDEVFALKKLKKSLANCIRISSFIIWEEISAS